MNIKLLNLAAVALLLGLTACNKEEAPSQEQVPANAVQITASVGNPFTRSSPLGTVEEQATFSSGDKILVYRRVVGSTFKVAYELDGATWAPVQSKYLLWVNDVET
ncbi:MAG: fimbrillin family protein, partial [Bacteroidales bacterium]|nr:fimbrillin family protein [Bacteroidales bacterium]